MPQFNHYETKSGRIIDPTFGLDALDAETKRKTKAREQMNTAAIVLRQELAKKGHGLSEGTKATVREGGGIEFSGDNAAADESRLYNVRTDNYGKSGKGTTTKEAQKRDALDALASQFGSRVAQGNQSQAGMQAAGNKAIGAYNATTLNTTLPTNTASGTQTPATTTPATTTPISPTTATILGGVLPSSLISPIYRPGVSAPLSNTQPTASAPAPNASAPTQQPSSNSMQAGTSVSFSSGGGTNSYSGSTEIDNTTESDIEVRDQLNMNQSDLATQDAMQALAFHLSGGQSPGTYRNMMDQNNRTMNATNDALAKQGTSQTIRAGIGEQQSSGAPNTSLSMSKDQKAASNNPGTQKPQLPTVNFVQSSSGQRNVAATVLPNGNYKMQSGTGVMFRNANLVSQIGASSGLLYNKQPDGSYSLAKGADEKKGIDNMYNQHAAAMENYQHLDGHRWEKKEVNGKKYVSFQKDVGGKWEEIGYHEYDAMHPVYTDGKNVESTVGNFAAGSTYKPMPKLTARPGKYGASGTHVELTQAEADLLYGDQGQ